MRELQEPKFSAFRFPDPRQQRIYEELQELVGPGPAAFFRDACRLMANPDQFRTTAHLVGHLLREIESALRAVFRPIVEATDKKRQKEEIHAILCSLGIPSHDPAARAWLELADNLQSFAHRRGLDAPRPPEEISELWNQIHVLLDVLLQSMRERFLVWIKALDELLTKTQPTKEDLKTLAQEIPNNQVTRRHFFDNLKSPEWLEPLRARGFFRNPPPPERNEEEGTIRFPPWPEARYLARMAQHKPELVAKIIQEMDDTDNAAVISDLVDALLAMPPEISARLVDKAERWAECLYLLVPDMLAQLLAHWAKGGRSKEALRVARVLLDILPDEGRGKPGPDETYRLPPEPRARFDTWEYEQILKKHYPALVREAGLPAVELLCELLDKAIGLSRSRDEDQGPEDYSYVRRPAIEDSSQNLGDTVEGALVSSIRDATELLVRSGRAIVEEVMNALEQRRWKVFRRVALHVLRVFPDHADALAAERLTDRALFDDVGLQHEYVLLLRDRFPRLLQTAQSTILRWIENGPDVDRWKKWRESQTGGEPTEEEITRYREIWQRDRLAWIGPENLPEAWRERYQALVQRYGEPEHPEFPVYSEGGWVGPSSPKTADELKTMSVTEIVDFLKAWKPPKNVFREPSPEGLGRTLSSVVAGNPERVAAEAKQFKGLDPTYVRALLSGLRDALKQSRFFDWEPVLELCEWVVSQHREIPGRNVRNMEADPDWGWTRKAIADLLSTGFEDRPSGIPFHLRKRVWAVLRPLTEDPDPTTEHEQRYGGSNMDPATLSINTVRGQAIHAVVRYALWARRHLEKEPGSKERLQRGFEEMPEVREVLEAHLDPAREPSLAIRAVYGQWFPWLVLLDPGWARTHAARIFPQDRESEAFFEAAWNTYIAFCRPYDNVFEILQPQYDYAVDRSGIRRDDTRWLENPDENLAEHLMVFYGRGKLSLDDSLFARFWQKAPDAVRAHALTFVGRSLKQTQGNIPAEVLERLKQLWEWRFTAAKEAPQPSDFEKEIAAFGWWFVSEKFDVAWSLAQLYAALQLVRKTEPAHMVLEHLSKTANTEPLLSVNCLRLIGEGDREGWGLYASRNHVRITLQQGLQDARSKQEAEKVIHYLGSRGFLDFKDLLKG